jgi:plastocyanin
MLRCEFTNTSQIDYTCIRAVSHTGAMKHFKTSLFLLSLWLPLFGQSAQTLTIPQVVDGGGWQTTIVLTNSTANPAAATLIFHSDATSGATQLWTPPFLEVSSTAGMSLDGGSTTFLHSVGTAAALTQGWAELQADAGVNAYAIFTNRIPGLRDQDGTSPAVAATNRVLVPYDASSGVSTAIAVVNPTGSPQDITAGFRNTGGGVAVSPLPTVPALGHLAFVLAQQFPAIAGHSGLAEFYSPTGNFSIISLRFNPTQSFTDAPVYTQTGPPIIGSTSAPPPTPQAIDIRNFTFAPTPANIQAGTQVTWTNHDGAAHTVIADDGSFQSGVLNPGQAFSEVVRVPGSHTYHCSIHPFMTGTIVVQ